MSKHFSAILLVTLIVTAPIAANAQVGNICTAVANYMAQQCNTANGPTQFCSGAELQLQACLNGQQQPTGTVGFDFKK